LPPINQAKKKPVKMIGLGFPKDKNERLMAQLSAKNTLVPTDISILSSLNKLFTEKLVFETF
jgi:hypothetical protein